MIDFVYTLPVLAVNRKGVTGTGGEYQFRWKPVDSFSISGSYADLDMSDGDDYPILYRSTHRGGLHFNYYSKIITIRLGAQGWSKQIYDDFLSHDYQPINGVFVFPIRELPERVIYELILSREIDTYIGTFSISNLLDTKYELIQEYPMPGRTWKFTLTKTIAAS